MKVYKVEGLLKHLYSIGVKCLFQRELPGRWSRRETGSQPQAFFLSKQPIPVLFAPIFVRLQYFHGDEL